MTADATNEVKANWEQPASASFAQWMESRVARFSTRKYDFDALKFQADFDRKYRRGQMRYIGTGGTGVAADSNVTMIGCGAIGSSVLELIANEPSLAIRSVGTSTAHMEQARVAIGKWAPYANVLEELAGDTPPDLVVECAGHAAIKQHVVPALARGIPCIVTSVGALSAPGMYEALEAAARAGKIQVQLISEAIGSIDALAGREVRRPDLGDLYSAQASEGMEVHASGRGLRSRCFNHRLLHLQRHRARRGAELPTKRKRGGDTFACRDRTGKNAGATICRSFGVRKHSPFRGCGGIRLLRAHFTWQASSGQPQDLLTHRVQRGEGLAKPQRRCLNLNAPNLQEKTLGYF